MYGNWKADIVEYWSFASEIISNNASIPSHVLFDIFDYIIFLYEKHMIIRKSVDNVYIHCGINYEDFPPSTELLQQIIAPSSLTKRNIKSYYIQHNGSEEDILYRARFNIIESVFNSLKNLNNFGIVRVHASNFLNYSFTVSSRNIEYEQIEYIPFEDEPMEYELDEEFTYDTLKSFSLSPTVLFDRLAHGRLSLMHCTEDITSMLNHFPNIKYLKIIDCGFTLDNNYNINIDLKGLQLKQLTIDITQFIKQGEKKRTIIFEIKEEENRISCFTWGKKKKRIQRNST